MNCQTAPLARYGGGAGDRSHGHHNVQTPALYVALRDLDEPHQSVACDQGRKAYQGGLDRERRGVVVPSFVVGLRVLGGRRIWSRAATAAAAAIASATATASAVATTAAATGGRGGRRDRGGDRRRGRLGWHRADRGGDRRRGRWGWSREIVENSGLSEASRVLRW